MADSTRFDRPEHARELQRALQRRKELGSKVDVLRARVLMLASRSPAPRAARSNRLGLGLVLTAQVPTLVVVGLLFAVPPDEPEPAPAHEVAVPAPTAAEPELPPRVAVAAPVAEAEVAALRSPPAPTGPADAVTIEELPFRHRGDTRASTERRIRSYSCAPGVVEGGAEVWYRVVLDEAGTLGASITEDKTDGIDVDLHLLHSDDGESCLARGNADIETEVAAGAYWLVLDTHGAGASEKPGPYRLTVAFLPSTGR